MKTFEIKLKTKTKIILSPRGSDALYKGIDYKEEGAEYSIIYPFYSRDNRFNKNSSPYTKSNSYYIPASSLKGALLQRNIVTEDSIRKNIVFRDVEINPKDIELKNLYKIKNVSRKDNTIEKQAKYDKYFENLGIEMLKRDIELTLPLILKEDDISIKEYIKETEKLTRKKLDNMLRNIEEISKYNESDEIKEIFNNLMTNIKSVNCDEKFFFLGGYKGLINSLSNVNNIESINSGIYMDDSYLPYGMVEIIDIK